MSAETLTLTRAQPERRSNRPEAERTSGLVVDDPAVARRIARDGIVGLGETFEEGLWSADHLDQVLHRVLTSSQRRLSVPVWAKLVAARLDQRLFNRQVGRSAFSVGVRHYDLGNDLFRCMLDESMTYTSGYWAEATTLEDAQEAKLDLLCRRLDLRPGQRVLDIGCGWGNFAEHAARRYGATVTGVTVSREQAAYARDRCDGLPVEIRLQDYRSVKGQFDHVVSIEMIEAVGRKNLGTYYRAIDRCLKPGGRCALQVISGDTFSRTSHRGMDQFCIWLLRHIFPNGYLPKPDELVPPRDTALRIDRWHRFDDDYEQTLLEWAARFNAGWHRLAARYDERFRRRWNFYLHGCVAAFRAGLIDVSQIVYTKAGPTLGRSKQEHR